MPFRLLKVAAAALALSGTGALLFFLNRSVQPEKKPPKLPSANVAALIPGQVITVETELLRYFVIKLAANEIHVVAIPADHGTAVMPELHWWKPMMNCKDFGLDKVDGRVTNESRFRCRDAGQPEEWVKRWQWNIYGKHLADASTEAIDNMYRVKIERAGDTLTFTGIEPD